MIVNKQLFFDLYKNELDKNNSLSYAEVQSIEEFIGFVNIFFGKFLITQWAYIFATVFHETNGTFKPVIEAYWLSEEWRKKHLRYYPYYGRGYVQITWERNYKVFSDFIGQNLVKYPELACIPKYAFQILIIGFEKGIFTGKKISDYICFGKKDYKNARRIINGTDKAVLIARYTETFEKILEKVK